jgi:hypothetical protein
LNRAYETLKDESSRRIYDIQWPQITKTYRAAQERAKRDAEAAKAENEKSAKEKAARDAEEQKSRSTLEGLAKKKQYFASEIFEVKRVITKLQSELKNIQTLEEKALAEERARNSWLTYMYSSVFRAPEEPEEAKQERELQRLQRLASKKIKENELSRKENKLKEWNAVLSGVEKAIATEISNSQERAKQAEREKEEAKRREEARAQKKRQEESIERERANRAAAEARAAQARAAAEASRRAAEERRKKEDEERRKLWADILRKGREEEERRKREEEAKEAEAQRNRIAERLRKMNAALDAARLRQNGTRTSAVPEASAWRGNGPSTRAARDTRPTAASSSSASAACQHRKWWDKVEDGRLLCGNCHTVQRLFLFQCPDCQMRACAGCRIALKKSGGNPRKGRPRGEWSSGSGSGSGSGVGARHERRCACGEVSMHDEDFGYDEGLGYDESPGYDESFAYDWYD